MFHNFQNYDSHLSFQDIRKHNFKVNVTLKTLEKHTSFNIKQAKKISFSWTSITIFINSLHFLNGSLDSLGEKVFFFENYLSQEFEYINSFELDPSHYLYTPGRDFYKHFLLLLFGDKSSIYT